MVTHKNEGFMDPQVSSKLRTECSELAKESYRCLESGDSVKCKPFFDAYKECRKAEHTRILSERRKASSGQ